MTRPNSTARPRQRRQPAHRAAGAAEDLEERDQRANDVAVEEEAQQRHLRERLAVILDRVELLRPECEDPGRSRCLA